MMALATAAGAMFRVTFQDDLVRMIEKRGSPLGHPFHLAFLTDYWAAGRLQSVWLQGNTSKSSPIPPRWPGLPRLHELLRLATN
jgi:hypothetical protein